MRLVALERDEVLRLLNAAKKSGPRSHAMCLLAIHHGLRASEVLGPTSRTPVETRIP